MSLIVRSVQEDQDWPQAHPRGDLLVPVEQVRERYFSNLNQDNFTRALTSGRVALPITTLDTSAKRPRFIDIRHLAIFIDTQADAADEELTNAQPQSDER
ncbi:pyocin activator PrtN family protein [Pseudomonas veronii]|uniref:pyocin activator PrtN family protein n=1 Tax=Pseudomonas veronii TaxID=76761 RepID=UPI0021AD9651|nr:pyocin activator PrtN family protein [Pseudomonas veronii]